eukprot:4361136-Karenia_brevis.AAC.1
MSSDNTPCDDDGAPPSNGTASGEVQHHGNTPVEHHIHHIQKHWTSHPQKYHAWKHSNGVTY